MRTNKNRLVIGWLMGAAVTATAIARGDDAKSEPDATPTPSSVGSPTAAGSAKPADSGNVAADAPPQPEPPPAKAAGSAKPASPATPEAASYATEVALESADHQQSLSLYGFMDLGFSKYHTGDNSKLLTLFPTRAATFVLGNINVFFDAQPAPGWRSLVEVRFTNLPQGVETLPANSTHYQAANTTVDDFTSSSLRGSTTLGSVVIERAQIEYSVADSLKLMAGYFFTPFGIWNIDHGTPTLISLILPSFESDQYIANRQLGVQVYGSTYTRNWELGYHAYLGNNRTPSQIDYRDDKSGGGRIFASSLGTKLKTKIGISGYYGHGSDISKDLVSFMPFQVQIKEVMAYQEAAVGADLSVDAGPLRLRTEGLVRRLEYYSGKNQGGADETYYNAYGIAAYRLPWLGLEPYAFVEAIHWKQSVGDTVLTPSVGLNVHFNAAVQMKMQYAHVMFFNTTGDPAEGNPHLNNLDTFAARLVVAF